MKRGTAAERARIAVRIPAAAAMTMVAAVLSAPAPAHGQVFLDQGEALRVAFPEPAVIERRTAFLSESQIERAGELAGVEIDASRSVVTYYVGVREGEPVGVAYFDVHRVRTLPEAVMFVVEPGGEIRRIEILKFSEPRRYMAPAGWLAQFRGDSLGPELSLGDDIAGITGATLTSRALTQAARRVLALHEVIDPLAEGGSP